MSLKKPPKQLKRFGRSVSHYQDFDYYEKLSDKDKLYLNSFNDQYYGGLNNYKVPREGQLITDPERIKEINRRKYHQKQDVLNIAHPIQSYDPDQSRLDPESSLILLESCEADLESDNPKRRSRAKKALKDKPSR